MIKSNLCDYSDTCIYCKRIMAISDTGTAVVPYNVDKKVIIKNCGPFTNCISEIDNIQLDVAHDIDVAMAMYNFIEYGDIYLKT